MDEAENATFLRTNPFTNHPSLAWFLGGLGSTVGASFIPDTDIEQGVALALAGGAIGLSGAIAAKELMEKKEGTHWRELIAPPVVSGLGALSSADDPLRAGIIASTLLPLSFGAQLHYDLSYSRAIKTRADSLWYIATDAHPIGAALSGGAAWAAVSGSLAQGLLASAIAYTSRGIIGAIHHNWNAYCLHLLSVAAEKLPRTPDWERALRFHEATFDSRTTVNASADFHARSGFLKSQLNELESSLASYEIASRLRSWAIDLASKDAPLAQARVDGALVSLEERIDRLASDDLETLRYGLMLEVRLQNLPLAERYAERITHIAPYSSHHHGVHALTLAVQRKFDQVPEAMRQSVRHSLNDLHGFDRAESVGESAHPVYAYDNGVIKGLLKLCADEQSARTEHERASFYYRRLGMRVPEPVPPINFSGRWYLFSRNFGGKNLLSAIREDIADYDDYMRLADSEIEVQRSTLAGVASGQLHADPNPYLDPSYGARRFEHLERILGNGLGEIKSAYLGLTSLLAHEAFTIGGFYTDAHPKQYVYGFDALARIDHGTLSSFSFLKDLIKLREFGGAYLNEELSGEFTDRILQGMRPLLAPDESERSFKNRCLDALNVVGAVAHLDMAVYAQLDADRSTGAINEFYTAAVPYHLERAAYFMRRAAELPAIGGLRLALRAGASSLESLNQMPLAYTVPLVHDRPRGAIEQLRSLRRSHQA